MIKIKKWGNLQKDKVDNIDEWVAWRWTNEKMKELGPFIAKRRPRQNPQLIEHDIKKHHWVMFRHIMEFLKHHTSLKKPLTKDYFTSFLKDLSNENLFALCGLLAT